MVVVVRLEVVASFEGGSYSLLLVSPFTVDLFIHCTNLIACSPSARILLAAREIIMSKAAKGACLLQWRDMGKKTWLSNHLLGQYVMGTC